MFSGDMAGDEGADDDDVCEDGGLTTIGRYSIGDVGLIGCKWAGVGVILGEVSVMATVLGIKTGLGLSLLRFATLYGLDLSGRMTGDVIIPSNDWCRDLDVPFGLCCWIEGVLGGVAIPFIWFCW